VKPVVPSRKPRTRHLPPLFLPPLFPCCAPLHRCPVGREEASRRILITRVGAFGDILMATPLLAALRASYPDAHLTWLVEHTEVEAIDANPYIDEYIKWDSAYWKRQLRWQRLPLGLLRARRFCAELRLRRYDVFISFQPEEWPWLVRGVNAPVTVGVFDTFRQTDGLTRTSPYVRLYSAAYTDNDLPLHRTDQYLLPLRALNLAEPTEKRMSMGFTTEDAAVADEFLRDRGLAARRPFVVLAPMTTWPSRCWPGERYAALGDALAQRFGCASVLIGSARPKEREAVAEVAARMESGPIQAAGVLSFRQMAALIARSSALVSGDTGPMHVAAAVGTPSVSLFGPTPVLGRAPLASGGVTLMHPVPCGPCDQKFCPNPPESHLRCMRLIGVDEVLEAVTGLLHPARADAELVR